MAHSFVAASVISASTLVPFSEKKIFRSCSNSSAGPAPGSVSQLASARRPLAVMAYTVRERRPTFSVLALARPWATSFLGSSYSLLWARGHIRPNDRSICWVSSYVLQGLMANSPRMAYDVVVIEALDMLLPLGVDLTTKGSIEPKGGGRGERERSRACGSFEPRAGQGLGWRRGRVLGGERRPVRPRARDVPPPVHEGCCDRPPRPGARHRLRH